MPQLLIAPEELVAVERRAIAAFPAECCGLLIGRREDGGTVRIGRAEACRNRAPDGHRAFTISPDELLVAYRKARDRGERVVGTYHSHPRGSAVPSDFDRASAWPGASYLIVGLGDEGVRERRSWRLDDGRFIEEEMVLGGADREPA